MVVAVLIGRLHLTADQVGWLWEEFRAVTSALPKHNGFSIYKNPGKREFTNEFTVRSVFEKVQFQSVWFQ